MKARRLRNREDSPSVKRREPTTCEPGEDSKFRTLDPRNVWPLILNILSCFLFMMNNYIIQPSSAYYANALGSSDALSGIMIGAASWLAFVSAVAYSFWTNRSYKNPLLFAACLQMVGNLLYASAYSYKSMSMCLWGRAISGLGAPRIIHRRYVADATPFILRTAVSAAFVVATAVGTASGPGMAIVLDNMKDFEFQLPILGRQFFNGMTGPGYFMAFCWGVFAVLVVFTFSEPKRSGLDELREREEQISSNKLIDFDCESAWESKGDHVSPNSPFHCIKHMNRAAIMCMAIIFMKRISSEAITGSTSIITKNRYLWSIQNVGVLNLVNGIIVIPSSILGGWLSRHYEDRFLTLWFLGITVGGMMIMVDPTDLFHGDPDEAYNTDHTFSVGPIRYIAGSLIASSGIVACESFVTSLVSKVVPSALAVGIFNSGLLVTLVGTGGKATSDFFITVMGLISIRNLLNLLLIPGMILMLVSMILIRRNYSLLKV